MNPGIYNFVIQQGIDFQREIRWSTKEGTSLIPVDITGYTAKLQIFPAYGDIPLIEWSTEGLNPLITNDGEKFIINVPSSITAGYTFKNATHEFEVTSPGGIKYKFLHGRVDIMIDRE